MLRVTWRNLLARRLRLLLSAFAVVLGVAFVAGSMIFTDAMGGAFDDIVEGSTADVEVAPEGAGDIDSLADRRTLPASLVETLEALPEVASAHPQNMRQDVFVIGKDGDVVSVGGAPGIAVNPSEAVAVTGEPVLELTEGELPDAAGEVALSEDTAEKAGYRLGDEVRLATAGSPPGLTAELVGIVDFGTSTVGATVTVLDTRFMQERFQGGRDVYTSIALNAEPGVGQRELADAAQEVLPEGVVARTGREIVEASEEFLEEVMGFLQTFLLVFAAVALVVGTFLIVNTFSILVAQRSRELALLRALGASRRQVIGSVVVEALAVGLVGSTVGLGAGWLLAQLLRVVFGRFGLDLAGAEFPVEPATVAWSYVVGLGVTLVASVLPALRASRIPPMAALRDDVALPEATLRRRVVAGVLLVLAGGGSMVAGFAGSGSTGLLLIGVGILLVLVGVALMSAVLGRPLLLVFAAAWRRAFGAVGALAGGNTLRNPRRTGATASALMIGLTLMTMMSIFGASAAESTEASVNRALTSQFVISDVTQRPFSPDVAERARRIEGVTAVARLQMAYPEVDGEGFQLAVAMEPEALPLAFAVRTESGRLADLRPGTVAVSRAFATREGLRVGDTVQFTLQGGTQELRVVALFAPGSVPGDFLVTPEVFERGALAAQDRMVFVTKAPDADTDEVRAALERAVEDLPTVTVKDPEAYVDEQRRQIDQFLNLIYGLLGLSVVIAVLGVVNTLGLSVIERTREIGLLRAVGLQRRQLRTMIRLEAIVVAVFGAVLGLAMGLGFGSAIVLRLEDQGLTHLAVPWPRLGLFLALAAVLGVVAAVLPARRAARLDVLRAIAAE